MRIEHKVKFPSLELSWLPNSITKGLLIPQIMYVSGSSAAGAYYQTQPSCSDWGDLRKRAIIAIDIVDDPDNIGDIIAHEYRHHWQLYKFGTSKEWPWFIPKGQTYKQAIIRYFRGAWHEMDALRFECAMHPTDVNMQWMEWLLTCP